MKDPQDWYDVLAERSEEMDCLLKRGMVWLKSVRNGSVAEKSSGCTG